MPLFSISVVARNEAKTLPKRLAPSLQEFLAAGGDAVLVDTGSTDGTADLARSLGFRVHEVGGKFRVPIGPLAGAINDLMVRGGDTPVVQPTDTFFDFAAARNYTDGLAKNDFVMVVAPDESFTRLDLAAIDRRIAAGAERMDVHYVHSHDAAGNPTMSFRRANFYDRRACDWVGVVHEVTREKHPAKFDALPENECKLEHWQEFSSNRSSYLPGLAWDCFHNRDKDRQSHYLARELMYYGRYHSAIAEFNRHIALPGWKLEQAQSRVYIGDCLQYLQDEPGALREWQAAFTMDPTRREALMRLAGFHYHRANHQAAAAYAAAALTIPENGNFYGDQAGHYRHEPHEILYVSLWWLGDRAGSKLHWQKALAYSPLNPKYAADAAFYS